MRFADGELMFYGNFESMNLVFEGGFQAPIVEMVDRFDMETDDPDEAEYITVALPPDGIISIINMVDLIAASELENEPIN